MCVCVVVVVVVVVIINKNKRTKKETNIILPCTMQCVFTRVLLDTFQAFLFSVFKMHYAVTDPLTN